MPIGWAVTVVVLCVAVIVLAVIVLGLLRQVAPVLERAAAAGHAHGSHAQGPPVGHRVPDFTVSGPGGEVTPEQLRGEPVVLLFLSPGCAPCEQLAAQMRDAGLDDLASKLVIVTQPGGPAELTLPASALILTEQAREVSDPLSVDGTPLAIALDQDGIVKAVRVTNTLKQLADIAATGAGPASRSEPDLGGTSEPARA